MKSVALTGMGEDQTELGQTVDEPQPISMDHGPTFPRIPGFFSSMRVHLCHAPLWHLLSPHLLTSSFHGSKLQRHCAAVEFRSFHVVVLVHRYHHLGLQEPCSRCSANNTNACRPARDSPAPAANLLNLRLRSFSVLLIAAIRSCSTGHLLGKV